MSTNRDLALLALRALAAEVEAGTLDVERIAYVDGDRVSLELVCVAPDPEAQIQAARVALGRVCPSCGSPEVANAGGMDRLCIRCHHGWRLADLSTAAKE